jgi:hypothetical protein
MKKKETNNFKREQLFLFIQPFYQLKILLIKRVNIILKKKNSAFALNLFKEAKSAS